MDPTTIGPEGREPRPATPAAALPRRPRPLLRTMLGDVLRRTRREQGRTLADVARAAKVSMPYLSEVERGRKEASSEVLAAICDALRIELSDLLAEVGQRSGGPPRGPRHPVLRLAAIPAPPRRAAGARPADAQCLLAA